MSKTQISLRLEEAERDILIAYCKATGRNQTDVLREFIRNLKRKMPKASNNV